MEDSEFLRQMRERIQKSAGVAVELELDHDDTTAIDVELSQAVPRVIMGSDALKYPGLARMFIQYAILCLRESRKVANQEFLLFLRRN